MVDAAVDVFADAFEEDPIRLAVAAAMAKLADEVRGLKRSPLPGWLTAQAEILALIEKTERPHDWVPFRSTDGRRGEQCMCGAIRWTAP